MGVKVDEAGADHELARVDYFRFWRCGEPLAPGRDASVLDQKIGWAVVKGRRVDEAASSDEQW